MPQIDFSSQFIYFSISLLAGVISGFIYSLFKIIRIVFPRSIIATVISDILFLVVFTIITLVFSIGFTDGFVRYYVLGGEILGFFAYKFSLGKLIDRLIVLVIKCLRKTVYYIQKFFVGFIKKLLKARDNMLYNKENKSHTCMQKDRKENTV